MQSAQAHRGTTFVQQGVHALELEAQQEGCQVLLLEFSRTRSRSSQTPAGAAEGHRNESDA